METKIIYYMPEDEKMPYLIKLNKSSEETTLRDFKMSLNANTKNYKFFFQTIVDDFGVVKEEIVDDDKKLPFINGRVVSWLLPIDANDNIQSINESAEKNGNITGSGAPTSINTIKPLANINTNTLEQRSTNSTNSANSSSINDSQNEDNIENQRKATRYSGQIKPFLKMTNIKKGHSNKSNEREK